MTKVYCEECNKSFYKSPSKIRRSDHDYCSVDCRRIARTDYETRNLIYSVLEDHPHPKREIEEYVDRKIEYILRSMRQKDIIKYDKVYEVIE